MRLTLILLPDAYAVCRLSPDEPVPAWYKEEGLFSSVVRTVDELSIMCREESVPTEAIAERGWRGLKIKGPLEFSMVGVLASLAGPLAEAGISIFVVSTFDTDYLFVKSEVLPDAIRILLKSGVRMDDQGADYPLY